jgi:hypothetical protein
MFSAACAWACKSCLVILDDGLTRYDAMICPNIASAFLNTSGGRLGRILRILLVGRPIFKGGMATPRSGESDKKTVARSGICGNGAVRAAPERGPEPCLNGASPRRPRKPRRCARTITIASTLIRGGRTNKGRRFDPNCCCGVNFRPTD